MRQRLTTIQSSCIEAHVLLHFYGYFKLASASTVYYLERFLRSFHLIVSAEKFVIPFIKDSLNNDNNDDSDTIIIILIITMMIMITMIICVIVELKCLLKMQ